MKINEASVIDAIIALADYAKDLENAENTKQELVSKVKEIANALASDEEVNVDIPGEESDMMDFEFDFNDDGEIVPATPVEPDEFDEFDLDFEEGTNFKSSLKKILIEDIDKEYWFDKADKIVQQNYDPSWVGNEQEAVIQWLSDTDQEFKELPQEYRHEIAEIIRAEYIIEDAPAGAMSAAGYVDASINNPSSSQAIYFPEKGKKKKKTKMMKRKSLETPEDKK